MAFELEKYFGLVGYPIIFHTDNGNEFVARQIIEMLAEINPAIITVTGRPRTPRDQGSVERVNATVKRAVASVCAERRREGKDDNWTMLLSLVTSSLNTHRSRLANSVEAYPTVFGAPYHIPIKTSLADARKCQTITELQPLLIDDGQCVQFKITCHRFKITCHRLEITCHRLKITCIESRLHDPNLEST